MYKDPDKQREANRKAQAKFKAKTKPLGITKQGDTLGITGGIVDRIEGITEQANIPADKRGQVRGKDIKCFADLPVDVQRTIDSLSRDSITGKIDEAAKARRAKIAIHYQTTCFGPQGM